MHWLIIIIQLMLIIIIQLMVMNCMKKMIRWIHQEDMDQSLSFIRRGSFLN